MPNAENQLIDIGANLTHQSFADDLEQVLVRAHEQGISEIIVTGTDVQGSSAASKLASKFSGRLFSTAGVHPHHADNFSDDCLQTLRGLAAEPNALAIGETGLDYHRNYSAVEAQLSAFESQLQLASELKMPVFVHERDAADDMVEILSRYRSELQRIVVHCFTGSEDTLRRYLDLDLYIGITGWICDERRGTHLRELVGLIPKGRLMLETDAPYLMPRDFPDKKYLQSSRRNEPCTLRHIAETVAQCRGETFAELAEHCRQTSLDFFGLSA